MNIHRRLHIQELYEPPTQNLIGRGWTWRRAFKRFPAHEIQELASLISNDKVGDIVTCGRCMAWGFVKGALTKNGPPLEVSRDGRNTMSL